MLSFSPHTLAGFFTHLVTWGDVSEPILVRRPSLQPLLNLVYTAASDEKPPTEQLTAQLRIRRTN